MGIHQLQFYESYPRMIVNAAEVFATGPPGCGNPLPGRPEQLCQDGTDNDGSGSEICPDRHISLMPPGHTGSLRSNGGQWQQTAFGEPVPPNPAADDVLLHEICLSNRQPDKVLDQFRCQIEEIPFGNGYEGSQQPITPPNQGGPDGMTPKMPVNNDFTNADPAIGFMEGTSIRLTASGGNIADWRYIILYLNNQNNPTHRYDRPLVGFWDVGEPITITDGQTHAFKFNLADLDTVGNIMKITRTEDPV